MARNTRPKPEVAILMGSSSDMEAMAPASQCLERLGIAHEVVVTSAHRTPERTTRYARAARGRGIKVLIVGAGRAAHLAGVVAAHTTLPVLGVPLASGPLAGVDALLSTVQMPAGIPVATLAIGGAENAALLAAEILALSNPALAGRLERERRKRARAVPGVVRTYPDE
ncbi:MAG: 5-(carboxyamino)imidazole ribonucleotide mutase [Candidatus Dadabacteria bacterium]|nr:MAG: 5-(carboxyamino)imidazole ribonucleotide mutase [Candidatus Dadabacteria bacterium]